MQGGLPAGRAPGKTFLKMNGFYRQFDPAAGGGYKDNNVISLMDPEGRPYPDLERFNFLPFCTFSAWGGGLTCLHFPRPPLISHVSFFKNI